MIRQKNIYKDIIKRVGPNKDAFKKSIKFPTVRSSLSIKIKVKER